MLNIPADNVRTVIQRHRFVDKIEAAGRAAAAAPQGATLGASRRSGARGAAGFYAGYPVKAAPRRDRRPHRAARAAPRRCRSRPTRVVARRARARRRTSPRHRAHAVYDPESPLYTLPLIFLAVATSARVMYPLDIAPARMVNGTGLRADPTSPRSPRCRRARARRPQRCCTRAATRVARARAAGRDARGVRGPRCRRCFFVYPVAHEATTAGPRGRARAYEAVAGGRAPCPRRSSSPRWSREARPAARRPPVPEQRRRGAQPRHPRARAVRRVRRLQRRARASRSGRRRTCDARRV